MRRSMISWLWMAAAAPLALMLLVGGGLYLFPSWANTISFLSCVALLAGSLLTGLVVLLALFVGWRRGEYKLRRAGALAAALLASLDVLVPACLVALVWMIARSMGHLMMML